MGCAIAFALHILGLSRWAAGHNLHGLVVVQLMTVTVTAALITMPDGLDVPSDSSAWAAVLVTGVAATALAYFLQTWVQTQLSASCVAVILTTEPVFAGLVAVGLAGEQLSDRAALGAVLVLAGMVLAAAGPSAVGPAAAGGAVCRRTVAGRAAGRARVRTCWRRPHAA